MPPAVPRPHLRPPRRVGGQRHAAAGDPAQRGGAARGRGPAAREEPGGHAEVWCGAPCMRSGGLAWWSAGAACRPAKQLPPGFPPSEAVAAALFLLGGARRCSQPASCGANRLPSLQEPSPTPPLPLSRRNASPASAQCNATGGDAPVGAAGCGDGGKSRRAVNDFHHDHATVSSPPVDPPPPHTHTPPPNTHTEIHMRMAPPTPSLSPPTHAAPAHRPPL